MKISQFSKTALVSFCLASMIACSAKIDASSPAGALDDGPAPSPGIQDIDGTWKTGCYVDPTTGFASNETLVLNGGNFKMDAKFYSTNGCTDSNLVFSQSQQGKFIIARESTFEPGSYEVDLEIPQGSDVTLIQHDLIRFENTKLYLGDSKAPMANNYPTKTDIQKAFTK